jgi:hypothetical protein
MKAAVSLLQQEHEKAAQETMELAGDYYRAIVAMSLHDVCGYGPRRIHRVWEKMAELAQCITAGTVSLGELQKFIRNDFKEEKEHGGSKRKRNISSPRNK